VASSSSIAVPRVRSKPSTSISKVRYHSVKRGDTLYGIARKYKTSVAALKTKNGLRNNIIGIGKRLRLP
jgi:membrane-bound lytic murein transglycosylase D